MEDDEVNQMLLKIMIEDQGAEFILEPDKEKAFEKMMSDEFDLIFLDTRIEDSNVLRFTRKLSLEKNISAPIIGMSSVDLRGRGIYNGLSQVLMKPIEYSKLKSAVQKLGIL